MPSLNSPILAGDVSGGLHSTSVDKLKGQPVASTAPSNGQVLTWDGSQWVPATNSSGGGGGANGLTYYLRQDVAADAPTTNLPGTPKQLGRTGATGQTSVTSGTLTAETWTLLGGYVSESVPIDPNITAIPGGLWDLNVWALGTANQQSPTVIRAKVYTYNGTDAPTLLATSGEQIINTVSAQYSVSVLVPQTTVQLTTRIYIEVEVKASANNHTATLQFGDGTPSHVHTSLPLVGGTGLWKNVAGVLQSPASLLVDADVASDAAISSSKLATVQVAQGGTGVTTSSGANSVVLRDANANISANAVSEAFQTVVKSATALTLTASSPRKFLLTGTSSEQLVRLPDVSTLQNGDVFYFANTGAGPVAITNSTSSIQVASANNGAPVELVLINNTNNTSTASWNVSTNIPSGAFWTNSTLNFGTSTSITGLVTWSGLTILPSRGGTGQTTFTDGQLLIGNSTGNTLSKATLTAGSNVTITNGPGTITIASTGGSATPTDVQIFTTPGAFTWTKPAGAKAINVQLLAGGGGGGSGRRDPSTTAVKCGGGGGGGGSYLNVTMPAAAFGDTVSGSVGSGGTGGAAVIGTTANGNNGAAGGNSVFDSLIATGGNAGIGGTISSGTGGNAGLNSNAGAAASTGGGAGNVGSPIALTVAWNYGGAGGGAGGGVNGSNAPSGGGIGGRSIALGFTGGTAGIVGGAGGAGTSNTSAASGIIAVGAGAGGGGGSTTAGGAGGAGGFPSSGGGGGGAGATDSGAGGAGAAGMAVITTYF